MPMDSLSIQSGICSSAAGRKKRHIDFHFGFCAHFKMKNCEKIDEWYIVLLKTIHEYIFGLSNKYQIQCKHFSQACFVLIMPQFSVNGSLKKVI